MRKKILTILYIALLFGLAPQHALARDYSLSIDPPLLRVHIKPGKSITKVYTIKNQSDNDKTLVASIVPFSEADNFGNPILNPKATAPWIGYFSLANAEIKFDKPFTVAAGASEQLVLSLSIPESAPLQDIYATLTVSTYQNTIDQTFQGTEVSATIGSNLLVTVSSQAFPDTVLKIIDFHPTQGTFVKLGNIYLVDSITSLKLSALVENDGNFATDTKGVLRVTTGGGKPVFLDGILPINVIAKSTRQLVNTKGDPFEFSPTLSQIGFHLISLEIKTDNSSAIGTIEIFFFPIKFSLGLFIAILLVVTITKVTSKPNKLQLDNQ